MVYLRDGDALLQQEVRNCFPRYRPLTSFSVLVPHRCLFLPSLAPHNGPTNNTNASGVSDGAVLSGMGTGKHTLELGDLIRTCRSSW